MGSKKLCVLKPILKKYAHRPRYVYLLENAVRERDIQFQREHDYISFQINLKGKVFFVKSNICNLTIQFISSLYLLLDRNTLRKWRV